MLTSTITVGNRQYFYSNILQDTTLATASMVHPATAVKGRALRFPPMVPRNSRSRYGPDRVGRRMVWTVDHATPDRAWISNPVLVRPCWTTDGMDRGPCNTGPCLDQYFCVGPSTLDRSCVGVLLGSIHHPRLKIISKKCSVCVTY